MSYLILGIIVFVAVHSVPQTKLRQTMVDRFSLRGYLMLFSLGSALGMGLLVYGKGNAEFIAIWNPPLWTRHLTMLLTLIATILLAASAIPNSIKNYINHPMLAGVGVWGAAHLIANGDLASMLLFGSFLGFSVYKIRVLNKRHASPEPKSVSLVWNAGTVGTGVGIYAAAVIFHQNIAGIPLF